MIAGVADIGSDIAPQESDMAQSDQRNVLSGVDKLSFGPQSDTFCSALSIALSHMGESGVEYHNLLCRSGRGFQICWNDQFFFWDRSMERPQADPEYYLRKDYASAAAAVEASGYDCKAIVNAECSHPEEGGGSVGSGQAVRDLVIGSVNEGRPVIAAFSVSAKHWAPEWSLITGYDEGGDTITGWSCFQDEEQEKEELELDPEGYFRRGEWEKDTVAVVAICGNRGVAADSGRADRRVLENGTSLSKGGVTGYEARGSESYRAWAEAVEDGGIEDLSDEVLRGRLQYHTNYVGHLAAQKWYTSVCLKDMEMKGWNVSDVLYAAGSYAGIHELMWDCWKVAGGYWRDPEEEVGKFRDPEARQEIAAIIRRAGTLDEAAVSHMAGALGAWDKSHAYFMKS